MSKDNASCNVQRLSKTETNITGIGGEVSRVQFK
jgi:hypothetical protein